MLCIWLLFLREKKQKSELFCCVVGWEWYIYCRTCMHSCINGFPFIEIIMFYYNICLLSSYINMKIHTANHDHVVTWWRWLFKKNKSFLSNEALPSSSLAWACTRNLAVEIFDCIINVKIRFLQKTSKVSLWLSWNKILFYFKLNQIYVFSCNGWLFNYQLFCLWLIKVN